MANQPTSQGESNNKPFVWLAVIAIIGLAIVALAAIGNQQPISVNTGNTDRNILTSTGTHVLEVAPDQAVLSMQVVTLNPTAKGASDANRVLLTQVLPALKAQGLVDNDIETTGVSLNKQQEWDPKNQVYVDKGYQQITSLKVTTKDLTKVGSILDAAVAAGANSVSDISFELQPATENKYKQEALASATTTATTKARILADAAGATLGRVTSVNENSYNYVPYYYNSKNSVADAGGALQAPTPISPQKVSISVSVTVSYELK